MFSEHLLYDNEDPVNSLFQVPSHYAPNYPRRSGGYSSLPMTGGQQDPYQAGMMMQQQQQQHALQQQQQQQQQQAQYAAGLQQQHQQMMQQQQGIYGQLPSSRGSDYATSRISSQSGENL